MEDFKAIAKEVLALEAQELLNAATYIGDEINEATHLIANLKGKLIITGVGKSGLIGAKIAATLASTGTSSFFLHPTEALHGDLGMIGKEDAVLAISYSGESEELIKILPHVKRFNIPLIGMARTKESSLGHYSDIFIPLHVTKEACPLDAAPTCSTTLTLALGDALAVCLMKKKNFQKEDFASFHPGGSLGKRLFIKISDLMLKEGLPLVRQETKLKDAIVKMSEGRLGNVLIIDEQNRLSAILSDGDLRRALMRDDFSMEKHAYEYATKTPKTLADETLLASDALAFIEKHKIQLLAITNSDGVLKGVLHIHHLVEAGIK
ncbi:KpsF/GutQ family sugar-phosphate isomerase [Sulfurospirillum barnesii]|uniref:KpsF/GutQ family protein n=1 Tax=Sulfurospirillum barnesii (strain ATCC 700032 / DSM 10660 / SES-3) TaxID=760154 RepID=I3XTY7_SULBS|nr:KpsF/GutQ family sugar-phosphate isomerase [Sulfurospirillum barnesii]AFL67411.1 KpsF/GutQ family protein [Sulfurospirillum barnesii SES-3]